MLVGAKVVVAAGIWPWGRIWSSAGREEHNSCVTNPTTAASYGGSRSTNEAAGKITKEDIHGH